MKDSKKKKYSGNFRKKKIKETSKAKNIFIVASLSFLLLCVSVGFVGAGFIYFHFSKDLPDVRKLKDHQPSTITQVFSASDEKIAEFYIEKRIITSLEDIPLPLKQATLAVEDSNFYFEKSSACPSFFN